MANKLSLNVKRSNFVIFRPYQKSIDYEVNIKIIDYSPNSLFSLERKECVRYLDVLIDSKLSWTHHNIPHFSAKINHVTPPIVSNLFTYSSKIHHHNTRFSAAGNFYLKHSRTDHMKNSFSRIGAKIWNSIPDSDGALPKYKFKDTLQSRLLDILIEEDNYVGVRT